MTRSALTTFLSISLSLHLPPFRRKSLHIFECLLFETDDLIMRKNEKHVILCLLEVARIGARFGMEAPMLVQMERQIDREIAADNKAMGTETDKMTHSISVGTDGNLFDDDSDDEDNIAEEPLLVYGPQPQIITNDLKSLDEMVSGREWARAVCGINQGRRGVKSGQSKQRTGS